MLLLDGISSCLKFKLILCDHSQHEWPELCRKGKRQSPIAVSKEDAKAVTIPPLDFCHYNKRYNACVENSGHLVTIRLCEEEECDIPTISGGNLGAEFVLDNVHIHWESEHTINDTRYPMEMHLVHYNKRCKNLQGALNDPEGLVVLAVMFRIAKCQNKKLDSLIETTEKVAHKIYTPTEIEGGFMVNYVLPKNRRKYYTYDGSLTTPNCNENVKWIIFEEIIPISEDQLCRLTTIDTESGEPVTENDRSLQERNDREVNYVGALSIRSIADFVKEKLGLRR